MLIVEFPKVLPLFSVGMMIPFPPPNWFIDGQPRVHITEPRQPTFIADTSPSGEAKTCAVPLPFVLMDEIAPLKVPFSNMVKD